MYTGLFTDAQNSIRWTTVSSPRFHTTLKPSIRNHCAAVFPLFTNHLLIVNFKTIIVVIMSFKETGQNNRTFLFRKKIGIIKKR